MWYVIGMVGMWQLIAKVVSNSNSVNSEGEKTGKRGSGW